MKVLYSYFEAVFYLCNHYNYSGKNVFNENVKWHERRLTWAQNEKCNSYIIII